MLLHHIRSYIKDSTLIARSNTLATALIAAPAHFFFFFIFKYAFHLPYENSGLRLTASLLCLSVLVKNHLPPSLQPYFPIYWHFAIIFVLPFIFTVNLLMNNFHELWLYWEIFMVFVLIMFVPHLLMFLIDLILGISAAIIFCFATNPHLHFYPTFNITLYSIVIFFSIIAGYAFSFSNWQSMKTEEREKAEEKAKALEALAGGIAHEMRNPLAQIRHNLEEISHEMPVIRPDDTMTTITSGDLEKVSRRISQAQMAVNRGLHVIEMTLSNFRKEDLSRKDLVCLSATLVTRKAIEEYGYSSEAERSMIHYYPGEDFLFMGDENNYMLVLYNLLVNALHVLQNRPDGRIEIKLQKGKKLNRISVMDNGPGIAQDILDKIFEPFFTSGKKGGTGLGLAFCRRVMHSFSGEITGYSQKGRYTEFILEFPVLDQSVISKHNTSLYNEFTPFFQGKNVLLAGHADEYTPLLRRNLLPLNVTVNESPDSKTALSTIATTDYDLVFTAASIACADADELAKKIRQTTGKEIPVISFISSIKPVTALYKNIDAFVSMPPVLSELLTVMKTALVTSREKLKETLSGKCVLVADDLDFNRKVIKSMLKKLDVDILESTNGLEALELLKTRHCDLLIIDLRMPVLDGFDTARQIRSENTPYRDIPILGLSGNLDNETLQTAAQSGISQCLLKPLKLKPFLQQVASMLHIEQQFG